MINVALTEIFCQSYVNPVQIIIKTYPSWHGIYDSAHEFKQTQISTRTLNLSTDIQPVWTLSNKKKTTPSN